MTKVDFETENKFYLLGAKVIVLPIFGSCLNSVDIVTSHKLHPESEPS